MIGQSLNKRGRAGAEPLRLVLAARDRLFRESLCLELAAAGCRIAEFDALEAALAHLAGGAGADDPADGLIADGLIIEAELAEAAEPPAWLAALPAAPPLVLLSAAGAGWSPAGRWAAVGVVDSAGPVEAVRADLLRRFASRPRGPEAARDEPAAGRLAFRDAGRLAFWRGRRLDLKDPELALLRGLTGAPGLDLTYRRARELLAAASGGGGEEVDPARFRGLVQRLIEKFREVDPAFDLIAFLPGRGYRWDGPPMPEDSSEDSSGESSQSGPTARSNLG